MMTLVISKWTQVNLQTVIKL